MGSNRSFSQTCSRLSQYLQKGGGLEETSSGDGAKGVPLGLFFRDPGEKTDCSSVGFCRSLDALPRLVPSDGVKSLSGESSIDAATRMAVQPDPETAQMTIFYAGKVVVYEAFPADIANMLMEAAEKVSTKSIPKTPSLPGSGTSTYVTQGLAPAKSPSDLPKIARRASLRRFLEKRRDRYE